jgi:hypothetical protein
VDERESRPMSSPYRPDGVGLFGSMGWFDGMVRRGCSKRAGCMNEM